MNSKLQTYREKLNLTQLELAEKTGISVRTIQRIEAGTIPKGHTLKVLSKVLQVSPEDLKLMDIEKTLNYSLIKGINLAALSFVIPFLNIVIPLCIIFYKKQFNSLTKQIVSIQILWLLITGILLIISAFLKRIFSLENGLILFITAISSPLLVRALGSIGLVRVSHSYPQRNSTKHIKPSRWRSFVDNSGACL